ncbi:MAG: NADH-quinone oxidoreductase subunit NuoN [Zoogloeaceae bacterium]|jgi:NADH-quinone oxidoreductase subunit N|nr:NADH-quinone oxidoreductase subunit NuoN [Zoogloeaceae bacterium]
MFDHFLIPDFALLAPEIFLLAMALILLVSETVVARSRTFSFAFAEATLILTAVLTFMLFLGKLDDMMMAHPLALSSFGGMFNGDPLSDFLKFFCEISVILTLLYGRRYLGEHQSVPQCEYYVLALLSTLGMMVMISANNLLIVYLGLEMMSLALYAMIALRRDSAKAAEAAMKYFVLGALATGALLYGMSLLYGAMGTLDLTALSNMSYFDSGKETGLIRVFALVFIVAGLAFKLGLVPFHMWLPDVYEGAPTPMTLFVAAAPKVAAFAILIRLLLGGLIVHVMDWQAMLLVLAILSMGLGNFVAIRQKNLKRMLAYSAIAQMGFMLLGLATGAVPHDLPLDVQQNLMTDAYGASLFYMVSYTITTLAAFGIILLLAKQGFESDTLEDFQGLNRKHPWLAAMMAILMFSLAGIPFFVGFFAKLVVLKATVAAGLMWVAVLAIIFSLVGAFYYLRVVKVMYFDDPLRDHEVEASWLTQTVVSLNALAVALLGIFPNTLLGICAVLMGGSGV